MWASYVKADLLSLPNSFLQHIRRVLSSISSRRVCTRRSLTETRQNRGMHRDGEGFTPPILMKIALGGLGGKNRKKMSCLCQKALQRIRALKPTEQKYAKSWAPRHTKTKIQGGASTPQKGTSRSGPRPRITWCVREGVKKVSRNCIHKSSARGCSHHAALGWP